MSRQIRAYGSDAEKSDPILPDYVPRERPSYYGPNHRAPLVLYIYRVPGKRGNSLKTKRRKEVTLTQVADLFLTQHKVQDNRLTSCAWSYSTPTDSRLIQHKSRRE